MTRDRVVTLRAGWIFVPPNERAQAHRNERGGVTIVRPTLKTDRIGCRCTLETLLQQPELLRLHPGHIAFAEAVLGIDRRPPAPEQSGRWTWAETLCLLRGAAVGAAFALFAIVLEALCGWR